MPELPEVETVARSLRPRLVGRTIRAVAPLDAKYRPLLAAGLTGRTFGPVTRRGKYLLLDLGGGEALMVHLRMSGRLLFQARRLADRFDRVEFKLEKGWLVYRDMRKLGELAIVDPGEIDRKLGPEPLGDAFTLPCLKALLARSKSPVKPFLLDQKKIAGIGNIYASESLFRARIDPATRSCDVTPAAARRLHRAIRETLGRAVDALGTSLGDAADYRDADGRAGGFQNQLAVYGRTGEPCPACGAKIQRLVQAQRSTFYCQHCQK